MSPHRLLPVLLAFTLVVPIHGQVRPQSHLDILLKDVNQALGHYQHFAPDINCKDATLKTLRHDCEIVLEMLASDVQYAKEKLASYQQLVTPQPVDLFDIYQAFQKVMEDIEILGCPQELYGKHNRVLFAEAYNTFVKLNGWFASEVRNTMQGAERSSECGHS